MNEIRFILHQHTAIDDAQSRRAREGKPPDAELATMASRYDARIDSAFEDLRNAGAVAPSL
jgi:hypothetical protein